MKKVALPVAVVCFAVVCLLMSYQENKELLALGEGYSDGCMDHKEGFTKRVFFVQPASPYAIGYDAGYSCPLPSIP